MKKEYRFFIQFIGLYLILILLFRGLVGITVQGGFYVPAAARYFDLVHWFANFIAGAAKTILQLLGYVVSQKTPSQLAILNSHGVNILYPCLGIYVMCFWVSFVFAIEGVLVTKLKWIATGVIIITLLNIVRIAFIVMAYHKHWQLVTSLDPHTVFNYLCYAMVLLLMFLFVKKHDIRNARAVNDTASNA